MICCMQYIRQNVRSIIDHAIKSVIGELVMSQRFHGKKIPNVFDQNLSINEISKILSVSESIIYRRMRQYNLSKLGFSTILDENTSL